MRQLRTSGDLFFDEDPPLIEAFATRAKTALRSARILLQQGQREDAVALAYYARLAAASALLAKNGIRCKNHAGTDLLLRKLYGITGLTEAKEQREAMQYDPEAFITKQEAEQSLSRAEDFVAIILAKEATDTGSLRDWLS